MGPKIIEYFKTKVTICDFTTYQSVLILYYQRYVCDIDKQVENKFLTIKKLATDHANFFLTII